MLRVGLTGGLATGKSFVGDAFAALGCHVLRADMLGHEVLLPQGEAYAGVVRLFGPGILDDQGFIVRRTLASLVFDHPDRLAELTALVHPPVIAREERWLEDVVGKDPGAIAIVEAAILIETGSYKRFSRLIVTACTTEQQIQRAVKRDKLSREEVEVRLKRQVPLAEKVRLADYVIDTSGEKEATVQQVRVVYEALRKQHV